MVRMRGIRGWGVGIRGIRVVGRWGTRTNRIQRSNRILLMGHRVEPCKIDVLYDLTKISQHPILIISPFILSISLSPFPTISSGPSSQILYPRGLYLSSPGNRPPASHIIHALIPQRESIEGSMYQGCATYLKKCALPVCGSSSLNHFLRMKEGRGGKQCLIRNLRTLMTEFRIAAFRRGGSFSLVAVSGSKERNSEFRTGTKEEGMGQEGGRTA